MPRADFQLRQLRRVLVGFVKQRSPLVRQEPNGGQSI